ncbi:efflux RND transporter permease subunit [Thalassobacter stenotrophicus]|uniref:Multidrug transporter MdtC n=2 Tax=Thalassobacter stenotrophicus TaxID=266809 RepID=A0A0P1EYD2_9RHOB|nr:efflux RND transporter permease subunit [Thalassobacter stenotrophicus]PVZ49851.1 AcrB/AcrD/AcrF family protein [Thalassobacter stenotrophicus]CUH59697.1 Multidrug transporter MdtC [Thalassobacter stenotrophicus]SHI91105.1 Multidrug efflux pump subunit AcrB [Thalassobacter stenotrophicus DSM 16310]
MSIISYFTRHRTAANLLLICLVVAGLAALPNMRAQFFPDVVVENVRVNVTWDGAGAEDVDAGVAQVLEPALLAVEGVSETTVTSREGNAAVRLDFEPGWDMSRAADDVQSAVDAVTGLPEGIDEPTVRRGNWRDRVTDVVITGPVGVDQLARFTDEYVTRLFAAGVTRTTIRGIAAPEIVVEVPTVALIRHDVTLAQIAEAIRAEADADPAGDVTGANTRVRTGVEKRDPAAVANIVLRREASGASLTIGDVATIRQDGVDRERAYFVGDNSAISIRVDRSAQGDAIAIQRAVADIAAEMELTLPEGVQIELIRTRAEAITGRIGILLDNGLMGLGLVVLILFLFLNARTAFWVAAGIPTAMMAALAFMYLAGITINMISLFALIITLGIVVDDAIVVGEHADFRVRRLGEDPITAAENAAKRMSLPVLSATITTIIAFFGLVAIGGRFGTLIADIPFTVIVVLIASLIECFLILPNHMAHALAHSAKEHWYDWPSRQVNRGFRYVREHLFRPFMGWVILARYPVVAVMVLLLATQAAVFIKGDVTWRFFNAPERSSVTGNFAMLEGATRADSIEMMREMQRAAQAVGAAYAEEYGTNPLAYVLSEVGGNAGRALDSADTKGPELLGSISIELIDPDLRPYSSFEFVAALRDEVQQTPLTEEVSFRGWRSGPGGDSISVQFYGANSETLKAAAEALKTALSPFPEVSGLQDTLPYDKDEVILQLTPQGEALGFDIDALGRTLRNRFSGIEAATFPVGPRTGAIRVELPEGELTADFLDRTLMPAPTGGFVPLADIVRTEVRSGFRTILRENGLRVVTVSGDLSEDDPQRATEIMERLRDVIVPQIEAEQQVAAQIGGLAEQESDFLSDALLGLILCLTGIYLVLSWIFASWTRPAVIMAIIPFGLIGTIYGHAQWDVPLSMFTVVGLIGMVGIIINDSIVLITTVDEYEQDRALVPAIIDATCDRLRPVFLTTMTTVLGLAPLLYESSSQAQFLRPTVITLCYGLGFGMVLVLLLVPALLSIGHDVQRQMVSLRRSLRLPVATRGRDFGLMSVGVGVILAAWAAATLGSVLVNGSLPGLLAPLLPPAPTLSATLGLFGAGSFVICVVGYIVGGVTLWRRGMA